MKKRLNANDIKAIKALNFLRYDYYGMLLFAGVLILTHQLLNQNLKLPFKQA